MAHYLIILNDYHYKIVMWITGLVFQLKLLPTILITVVHSSGRILFTDWTKVDRTGPAAQNLDRRTRPLHQLLHVCNAYGYASSNQIPIFFPTSYHMVTVTACISIDSIGVLHAEKTKIALCRNIGLYSYVMHEVWIYAIHGLSCTK